MTRPVPDAEKWGLYKSTDRGATWTFVHNGTADASECTGSADEFLNTEPCSPRGVRHVEIDPTHPNTIYASSFARGIWRSTDEGATWAQIKPSLDSTQVTSRAAFDVTTLPNGKSRMYVYEGNVGVEYARLSRSDSVATGTPTFTNLSTANPARTGFATYNQCGGQCWYDVFVFTPDGYPDIVYSGGSYSYGETTANKRAVVLSTDAGVSGTDMTFDGTDIDHPNGLHPDQHDLVTNPRNPYQFFETGDGGVVRSSGTFVNRSYWCDDERRGLSGAELDRCKQMLSKIPERITGINTGLSTLQFVSLSVSNLQDGFLQGGTQDNGTWENKGETTTWNNTMVGDGGQSGFDAEDASFRVHTFFDASPEVNFNNGAIGDWIWTGDPIYGQGGSLFYVPITTDPLVSGTMFAGTVRTAYRTTTFGLGDRSLAEAQKICNTWTGTFAETCGDWQELGTKQLTAAVWGDRAGGAVAQIARTTANEGTAWAATSTGRLFISKNVATDNASDVTWNRLDHDAVTPGRFITGIYAHPDRPNRAFVSYSGYDSNTPDTPGHIFRVVYHPETGTSTWRDLTCDFGDLPVNDIVKDTRTGDIYLSTDFGVLRRPAGTQTWVEASRALPNVEVAGLTLDEDRRILYAATHGLGAWSLKLPVHKSGAAH